jgi:hypothetical protein
MNTTPEPESPADAPPATPGPVGGSGGQFLGVVMAKDYSKNPYRRFRLTRDVVVPAGAELSAAPLERGGMERIEAIVGLGNDATAYLNVPLYVVEVDAAEWFEEVTDDDTRG